jgi:hypothetical protein
MGPTGSSGSAGMDNLATSNFLNGVEFIIAGDPVTFNGPVVSGGSGITLSGADLATFTLANPGNYFIEFVGLPTSSGGGGANQVQLNGLFAGVQAKLNGNLVGPVAKAIVGGNPVILQTIIQVASPGSQLQIVVSGLPLIFSVGNSATITIIKLS